MIGIPLILNLVDCGPLPSPANGTITLTGTLVGSTATYTCDSGYERVVCTNLVCQDNGNWSGTPMCSQSEQYLDMPECTIHITLLTLTCVESIVDCGAPQQPANGQVIHNETVFGSVANYSCNALYSIVGDASRECLANGIWSGIEPRCEFDNLEAIIGTVVVVTVIINLSVLILVVSCNEFRQRRVRPQLPVNYEQSRKFSSISLNSVQTFVRKFANKEVIFFMIHDFRVPTARNG